MRAAYSHNSLGLQRYFSNSFDQWRHFIREQIVQKGSEFSFDKTNLLTKVRYVHSLTLSVLTLWNTSPVWGGQICPPFNYGYWRMFSSFFLARVLFLDVKGQNLKAQPSTSKNVALRALRKIYIFGQNLKKFKNRYLEIRLFIGKNAVKIKPRNIGCSSFL